MATVLRYALAGIFGLIGLGSFGVVWLSNDLGAYQSSLATSKDILSDLRRVAEVSERLRLESGQIPNHLISILQLLWQERLPL